MVTDLRAKKFMKRAIRNMKIIKLLITITVIFSLLWSPFVITRIVRRIIKVPQVVWTAIQLIIMISTTTNFFITMKMSAEFKKTVVSLINCTNIGVPDVEPGEMLHPPIL